MTGSQQHATQRQKRVKTKLLWPIIIGVVSIIVIAVAIRLYPLLSPFFTPLYIVIGIISGLVTLFLSLISPFRRTSATREHTVQSSPVIVNSEAKPHTSRSSDVLPPFWNVPLQRSELFTGREEALQQIHSAFAKGKTAALVHHPKAITGLGGIGKTRTAMEYAYRYHHEYEAVFWVRAESRETLMSDLVTIATIVNLPIAQERNRKVVTDAVIRWLSEHTSWLLIFDNVEDARAVNDFLHLSRNGHILLTTRIHTLGYMIENIPLQEMGEEEGALLLLHRANLLAPDAPFDTASLPDRDKARELSKLLGGLPLALDHAGAYILGTQCNLASYLDLYQKHGVHLFDGQTASRTSKTTAILTDHPEPVTKTFALSFEKVKRTHRAAAELLQLCAFLQPDAIPEEMIMKAAPVLGPLLGPAAADPLQFDDMIRVLLKFSLVKRDYVTSTIAIHRLVQSVIKTMTMTVQQRREWGERTVRVFNQALPDVNHAPWSDYERFLPHAEICAALIKDWKLKSVEAARLLDQTGNYLRERAQYSQAAIYLVHARNMRQQTLKASHPDQAISLNSLGLLSYHQGKYAEAEHYLKEALSIRQKAFGQMHPDVATSLDDLGWLYHNQNKYAEAEVLCEQALAIRRNLLEPYHLDIAQNLHHLFLICRARGKYSKAEEYFEQALRIREDILGPIDARVATLLNDYAWLCRSLSRYNEAGQLYRRVLTTRWKILGKEHLHTATCIEDWTTLHVESGKYQKAEARYKRVLEIRKRELGQEHHQIALTLNNLATLFFLQGQYARAEALYKQAVAIREKALGSEHRHVAISLDGLAEAYRAQGKFAEAQPLYERALTISTHALGATHPHTATIVHHIALFYFDQGNYSQAEQLYEQALQYREEVFGSEHPTVALSLHGLAKLYHAQGLYAQAEPLYQRALTIRTNMLGSMHPLVLTILNDLARLHCEQDKEGR